MKNTLLDEYLMHLLETFLSVNKIVDRGGQK